jgi:hypothetical protein
MISSWGKACEGRWRFFQKNRLCPKSPPLIMGSCERLNGGMKWPLSLPGGGPNSRRQNPAGDGSRRSASPTSAKRRRQPGNMDIETNGFSLRLHELDILWATEKRAPVLVPPRRDEFGPSPGMQGPSNFPLPQFFHSFRGGRGDFRQRRRTTEREKNGQHRNYRNAVGRRREGEDR